MLRWQELLNKLEARKSTLSGFNNLMAMFREIESIQEKLKDVQVGTHLVHVFYTNDFQYWAASDHARPSLLCRKVQVYSFCFQPTVVHNSVISEGSAGRHRCTPIVSYPQLSLLL